MRASSVAVAFFACLAAAVAAWLLRRPVDDADLAAMAMVALAVGGAVATLAGRRVAAGIAVLAAAAGLWAATGGIGQYLDRRAPPAIGTALAIALLALVFAGAPADPQRTSRKSGSSSDGGR